ncbi:hypothetical protein FH589_07915 [Leptospira interrogans]|uniref:hypothetical protein n=2 Tax=Leptospira interrogans TaxID=173 RepID=UPI001FEF9548|nr:hypothetical protein [Leptospira interrogans]ULG79313.1 hypothetical protein FH595_11000 [Leptospira interrogans]UML70038.1 hypothetical protein FH589_07915 [Leptospira interrogans]
MILFLTICSWMAFCLCYTTFEAFLRPLYYFGEVSFKNLILSDICGVGYGSQTQRLTLHGSFDRSRLELSRTLSYGSRLELSRTLSYGSRSRLKLKAKYRITFLSYNLLTEAENAAGFIQAFLL